MNITDKFHQSVKELRSAYKRKKESLDDYLIYAGIAKCFEVALEYTWKYLKQELEDAGLDPYSPKDVVKTAGREGIITDVEKWIKFINVRNIAVHDYLGVTQKEYLETIGEFLVEIGKIQHPD